MAKVGIVGVSEEVAVACMLAIDSVVVGGISDPVNVEEGGIVVGEGNAVGADCVIRVITTTPITKVIKNTMIGENSFFIF
jgi:hypothetical protein